MHISLLRMPPPLRAGLTGLFSPSRSPCSTAAAGPRLSTRFTVRGIVRTGLTTTVLAVLILIAKRAAV